ncbi:MULTISPECIES: DUF2059 domain-containing protein [Mesorhizobium]|uniref:DUF2059 domain-containing protein n=1 Tax=Mesorhizobium denitrificans TaxID=2294114 RepID=A0A371X1Z8_9HYPH|nr:MULTISPECIES: DUF2059 domain-containing protein [Mesorhizobium]RFC63255.1 DUF2059 domain-containing protein [Mesorhizobium denitrificans]
MTLLSFARAALLSGAMVALALPASAQDISESHLKAARDAVTAIQATAMYDNILPQAAFALKQELIQQNPDMQEVISKTVDEQALKLVTRRTDLEREAAQVYAKAMSEEDLRNIANFYNSETGKKLLETAPIVTREVIKAADIWQRGVARDLAQAVGTQLQELDKAAGKTAPAQPAPAEGEQPQN